MKNLKYILLAGALFSSVESSAFISPKHAHKIGPRMDALHPGMTAAERAHVIEHFRLKLKDPGQLRDVTAAQVRGVLNAYRAAHPAPAARRAPPPPPRNPSAASGAGAGGAGAPVTPPPPSYDETIRKKAAEAARAARAAARAVVRTDPKTIDQANTAAEAAAEAAEAARKLGMGLPDNDPLNIAAFDALDAAQIAGEAAEAAARSRTAASGASAAVAAIPKAIVATKAQADQVQTGTAVNIDGIVFKIRARVVRVSSRGNYIIKEVGKDDKLGDAEMSIAKNTLPSIFPSLEVGEDLLLTKFNNHTKGRGATKILSKSPYNIRVVQ